MAIEEKQSDYSWIGQVTFECVKDLAGQTNPKNKRKVPSPAARSFFVSLGIRTALNLFVQAEDQNQVKRVLDSRIPQRLATLLG